MADVSARQPGMDSELTTAALTFARRVHLGQHRKQTGDQYAEHPIEVAELLEESGCNGSLVAAAYLHDVVEKTDVELDEIRERFGPAVAKLVDCLSEDPEIPAYAERKRDLRQHVIGAGADPALIYAADRLANMRDWRKLSAERRPPVAEQLGTTVEERLVLWQEDLEELYDLDTEMPFLPEMQSELDALRAESQAG